MKDKVNEFKQCLKTFGYRNLDEKVMAKPLAFLLIYVNVTENKAVFDVMFKTYYDDSPMLWSEHEIVFNEENEYIFENSENLSKRIAVAEYELFAHHNPIHNGENVVPKYNLNGITDFIVSSAYGHIEGAAHTYTPEQWSAHLGFNAHREFRWAYEKDLINFD